MTSAPLMRAVIDRDQGLRTGRRISHVFYMTAPERDGAICITDAAINVSPDVDAKLDIIRNAATLFSAINDGEAKVALEEMEAALGRGAALRREPGYARDRYEVVIA